MKVCSSFYSILFIFSCGTIFSHLSGEVTDIFTRVGEFAVFDCELDFPHDIIIPHVLQWKKDKEIIFSWSDGVPTYSDHFINRINLLSEKDAWQHGRGSINLTNIRETDEGWYECKVIFPNRTPSSKPNGTWFHLQVEGGNLIAVPPINKTIMEGESTSLKCVSKISSALVTWYKDNAPVTEIDSLKTRVEILPEGSLIISNTEMKDSGYYACEITNEVGEKQSAGAYLNVQFKAKIIYAPRRVFLAHGRPGHLECFYKANPEITKIRWEKDGFLFDAYNVPGVFSRKNGSLYFSKVDDSHGGEYTCTPYNDLGTSGPSPRMNVIVRKAPVFTLTPHVIYLRKIGETVVMYCDAIDGEGVERPLISWYRKNNREIPHGRSFISGGNLTITNIQKHDRGSYLCVATNEAATITSEAELIVEENIHPQAPYNVTADISTNFVKVRWLSAVEKLPFKFSVWYRSQHSLEWKMIELNTSKMYEADIANLNPGETYEVMVLSENENGEGMFSKTIKITTKSEHLVHETESEMETDPQFQSPVGLYQQIGPPTDVYVQLTDEGHKVLWKPPKHGQEMLKYYTVLWFKESSEEKLGVIETFTNSAIIDNLEEQKTYKIQIRAMSTNDYESFSQKYIYYVPSYSMKKAFFVGIAGGSLLITIILITCWYICNINTKTIFS